MKNILERVPNIHWIGVEFSQEKHKQHLSRPIRFCQAVREAVFQSEPFVLCKENVNCPGAQYAFGWEDDISCLKEKLAKDHGIDEKTIDKIFKNIKRPKTNINSIIIKSKDPDIYIGFIQPGDALKIIQYHTVKNRSVLDNKIMPVLAICLNTALKSFYSNEVVFSFGCDDSRRYCDIGGDRLVVSIPNYDKRRKNFTSSYEEERADLRV